MSTKNKKYKDINVKDINFIEITYDDDFVEIYNNIIDYGWINGGMFMIKTITEETYLHPFILVKIKISYKDEKIENNLMEMNLSG